MKIKPTIYIVSVFKSNQCDLVNNRKHQQTIEALKLAGTPVSELQGQYKGQPEKSILIVGLEFQPTVEKLARLFDQECYLVSHSDRSTDLVYQDGTQIAIGQLRPVDGTNIAGLDSWTYSPILDQYYATLP
jgi:hypothetical protein